MNFFFIWWKIFSFPWAVRYQNKHTTQCFLHWHLSTTVLSGLCFSTPKILKSNLALGNSIANAAIGITCSGGPESFHPLELGVFTLNDIKLSLVMLPKLVVSTGNWCQVLHIAPSELFAQISIFLTSHLQANSFLLLILKES